MTSTVGSGSLAAIAIVLVIFMVIIGALPGPKSLHWVAIAGLMVGFIVIIGKSINGRATGILIDERKVMSLSRFQITIWTVIIVSAYFTMASARIYAGVEDPLAIAIDWRLWALLGISSTSLVGTPLILDSKKRKKMDVKKIGKLRSNVKADENVEGIVFVNRQVTDAKFSDMFEGDEAGNEDHVDMSKVQMFFFTIISALSYVVLLFNILDTSVPTSLPILPEGLIALLTISHGAYLTNKTVNHT